MNVVELLFQLLRTPNIEIVEAPLPERGMRMRRRQPRRHFLLENLKRLRRRPELRFRDQKMHMLRHHDVAEQKKSMVMTGDVENLYKTAPTRRTPEKWQPMVATEGNEVQIVTAVEALERTASFSDEHLTNLRYQYDKLYYNVINTKAGKVKVKTRTL